MSFLFLFLVFFLNICAASLECINSKDKYIGDLCYTLHTDKKSYSDAEFWCHNRNIVYSNLAVLHTTVQTNYLATFMRMEAGMSGEEFWIGLKRPTDASKFYWDDGTQMIWNNFNSGFPITNYATESTSNGKWKTADKETLLPFVCSYNPNNVVSVSPEYNTPTVSITETTPQPTTSYQSYETTPQPTTSYQSYETSTQETSTGNYETTPQPTTWYQSYDLEKKSMKVNKRQQRFSVLLQRLTKHQKQ